MENNRMLVYGRLFKVDNTLEYKGNYRGEHELPKNVYVVDKGEEQIKIKENYNTYLLQTEIVHENVELEYLIYPDSDSLQTIRDIVTSTNSKLNKESFFFDCRIDTFRNPPYIQFKNAKVLDTQEKLDASADTTNLYKSFILCNVVSTYPNPRDDLYNYMLVKTINHSSYNNPLKLHYKDTSLNSLTGKQEFDVKLINDKLVIVNVL